MTHPLDHLAPVITLPAPQAWRWHPEAAQPRKSPSEATYAQGALALSYRLPGGLDAVPPGANHGETGRSVEFDALVPDPHAWAARFLQAVIEVISSDRPVTQLARWTAPPVYDDIHRRQQQVLQHRGSGGSIRTSRQQVATVHVCQPEADVAEVAARVAFGHRSRAIAARMDFQRGRWTCTALVFG